MNSQTEVSFVVILMSHVNIITC